MSQKIENLYNKITSTFNDKFDQSSIRAHLLTRIAAGLEAHEDTPTAVGLKSKSEAWDITNGFLLELIEQNPEKALDEAISLIFTPKSEDKKQEQINRWMRTSGLTLLGADELVSLLDKRLESIEGLALSLALEESFIKTDVSDLRTIEDMEDPRGFSTVQAVYIALGLADAASAIGQGLYAAASERLNDPDFRYTANIIRQFPDCAYLNDRLPTF
ncbi:MAG: hypothetical protein NUV98_05610 [Candidatus Roizmanbacteria bacterium]|nr:hypothetical protein [Candidatus Roizmanbacteria bacterium]